MLANSLISRRSGDVIKAEKEFQTNLDKSVKRFEELRNSHTDEYAKYEVLIFNHFASLKCDIDLSREQLKLKINDTDSLSEQRKLKIDDSANELIDRIEKRENEFKVMLLERKMDGMHIESVSVDEPFRNPKLVTKSAVQLIYELKLKNNKLSNIVNSLITLRIDLSYCTFKANTERRMSSNEIGRLTLENEHKWLDDEREDYYDRCYDDDYEYNRERNDDLDFTACDKDDCGYCGHCNY